MAKQLKVNNEKGSVMNVALLVLLVLSLIGFSLSKISAIDTKIAGNEKLERIAYYAAEAGLERAMQFLKSGDLADADWLDTKIAFGDAHYKVVVRDFDGSAGTTPVTTGSTSAPAPVSTGSTSVPASGSTSWLSAGGLEDDFDDLDFYDGMGGTSTGSTGSCTGTPPSFSSTASFGSTSGMFDDAFESFELDSAIDDDLLLIRATGYMNNVERSIEVVFSRVSYAHAIQIDGTVAAYTVGLVEVEGDNVGTIRSLMGENHNVPIVGQDCFSCNGSAPSGPHDTIAGLYSHVNDPDLTGIGVIMNIQGTPGVQVGGSLNSADDWKTLAEDLIQDGVVHNKLNEDGSSSTSEVQILGTRAEPQITYIEGGDFTFNNTVIGNGILVADNGLIFNDNLQFEGLIIILNSDASDAADELDFGLVNSRIFGAIVIAGNSATDIRLRQRGLIQYSTEALSNIEGLLSGVIPKVLTWREY